MSYSSEVLADSPLVYYRLGEASGLVANDSSGNGRHANYLNSPTLGVPGLLLGDSDTAMELTANNGQAASIIAAAWMDVSAFTVEALVKFSSSYDGTNGDAIISRYTGAGYQWLLWRTTGNTLGLQVVIGGATVYNCNTSISPALGTAYHVAGTWDGTTAKVYVDGSLAATVSAPGSLGASSAPFEVGRYSEAVATTPGAVIDEAAFYGAALSSTRIAAHYAAATASPGVTGTVSATLPNLSADLSGGVTYSGTLAATLPALGANLSGTATPPGIAGTLLAALPPLGASLAGAYSDTATLAAILPPLSANLTGTYAPPPVAGALGANLPGLAANLAGTAYEPGMTGTLNALLPALTASLSGDVLGRTGLGLALDSSAVLTVNAALEPEPTVPAGTPSTALHIIAPTVPVPTLVAGRPQ